MIFQLFSSFAWGIAIVLIPYPLYCSARASGWWRKREENKGNDKNVVPKSQKIACIVPSYGEKPELLLDTLRSINGLNRKKKTVDIFLLEDSDEFMEELADECRKIGITIIKREQKNWARAGAMNNFLELNAKSYDYVLIIDADEKLMDLRIIEEMLQGFTDQKIAVVQSRKGSGNSRSSKAIEAMNSAYYDTIIPARQMDRLPSFAGSAAMVRTNLVERFPEGALEDAQLNLDLANKGFTTAYIPNEFVKAGEHSTIFQHVGQQLRYCIGHGEIVRRLAREDCLDYVQLWHMAMQTIGYQLYHLMFMLGFMAGPMTAIPLAGIQLLLNFLTTRDLKSSLLMLFSTFCTSLFSLQMFMVGLLGKTYRTGTARSNEYNMDEMVKIGWAAAGLLGFLLLEPVHAILFALYALSPYVLKPIEQLL